MFSVGEDQVRLCCCDLRFEDIVIRLNFHCQHDVTVGASIERVKIAYSVHASS